MREVWKELFIRQHRIDEQGIYPDQEASYQSQ
jgi:hypothetical protein